MKKNWWILPLVLLLAAALVAGYFLYRSAQEPEPLTPEEILEAARGGMKDVTSMRFSMEMGMDVTVLGKALGVDVAMDGEMTAEPSMAHGFATMQMGDQKLADMELYVEKQADSATAYIGVEVLDHKTWTKQDASLDETASAVSDMQQGTMEILELATVLADVEPEQISETELRYTGVVPAEKIEMAIRAAGVMSQLKGIELFREDLLLEMAAELEDMPITITVDREKLVVTGYEMDMTSVIREVMKRALVETLKPLGLESMAENAMSVTQVTMSMRFDGFGEVEPIVIPEEVKAS